MDAPTDEQLVTTVAQLRQRIADLEASAAVLDSLLDCIITMDADGRVIEFNAAAERTFGYTKADAIGRALSDLIIPPLLRDAHAAGLARYLETGEGQLIGKLIKMTFLSVLTTVLGTELGIFQRLLETTHLKLTQWGICLGVSLSIVIVCEIWKLVLRRLPPKEAPANQSAELRPATQG